MIQIKDEKVRKAGSTVQSRTLLGKKYDRSMFENPSHYRKNSIYN